MLLWAWVCACVRVLRTHQNEVPNKIIGGLSSELFSGESTFATTHTHTHGLLHLDPRLQVLTEHGPGAVAVQPDVFELLLHGLADLRRNLNGRTLREEGLGVDVAGIRHAQCLPILVEGVAPLVAQVLILDHQEHTLRP